MRSYLLHSRLLAVTSQKWIRVDSERWVSCVYARAPVKLRAKVMITFCWLAQRARSLSTTAEGRASNRYISTSSHPRQQHPQPHRPTPPRGRHEPAAARCWTAWSSLELGHTPTGGSGPSCSALGLESSSSRPSLGAGERQVAPAPWRRPSTRWQRRGARRSSARRSSC